MATMSAKPANRFRGHLIAPAICESGRGTGCRFSLVGPRFLKGDSAKSTV